MAKNKKLIRALDEKFAQVWHLTSNKSEAYRQIHDCTDWTPSSITTEAHKYSKRPDVILTYTALQEEAREAHRVTVDDITKMHKRAFEVGEETSQAGAMTTSANNLAKLHGLIVDKAELSNPDGSLATPKVITIIGK